MTELYSVPSRLDSSRFIEKMVFLGGPRQVGKTTFAQTFIKGSHQYFSWDDLKDRTKIKAHEIPIDIKCVVLDEIPNMSAGEC